MAEPPYQVGRG